MTMTELEREEFAKRLDMVTRERDYYKNLAQTSGKRRLEETEELRLILLKLRETEKRLSNASEELEQRVEERTKELVEANKQLQQEIESRQEAERKIKKINEELELEVAKRTLELQNAYEKVKELSLSDQLSGLRNRRFMSEVITPEAEKVMRTFLNTKQGSNRRTSSLNTSLGIIMIDIDHFKDVNDTYGHKAGDELLLEFCQVLRKNTRVEDYLIRWGGEEFLVILRSFNPHFLMEKAEKIRQSIMKSVFSVEGASEIRKTCSLGCVNYPFNEYVTDFITIDQAILVADIALYYAKKAGRNKTVVLYFSENQLLDAETVTAIIASHHDALERKVISLRIFPE